MRDLRDLLADIIRNTAGTDASVSRAFMANASGLRSAREVRDAFLRALGEAGSDERSALLMPTAAALGHDDVDDVMTRAKEFLAEPRHRIRLSDLVDVEIRAARVALSDEEFRLDAPFDAESFSVRVEKYEAVTQRLLVLSMLVARWGDDEAEALIERIGSHLAPLGPRGGINAWIALEWYPLLITMYGIGLACEARQQFKPIARFWATRFRGDTSGLAHLPLLPRVTVQLTDLQSGVWSQLPGLKQYKFPLSEHLFSFFKPLEDRILFLGAGYEECFDRFEILYALAHADDRVRGERNVWGPVGRFGWKHRRSHESPYALLVAEGKSAGSSWPAVRDGLFGGEPDRFEELAEKYSTQVLDKVNLW